MKDPFCTALKQELPLNSESVDYYSLSFIANCVFNAFLSYTAITLNIATIHAIRKTPSLPKPLGTLLLSLAVSDLGVGLLVQPLYIALLLNTLQHNSSNCFLVTAFVIIMSMVTSASFFGVVAISVDRFLAIHLHLRYQELVTHKRVVAVVISIWLISLLSPLIFFQPFISFLISAVFGAVSQAVISFLYLKIYLVVRRHKKQIHDQRQSTQNLMETTANLNKSASGTFYVYLVFSVCYLPHFCTLCVSKIYGPTTVTQGLAFYTVTLIFLNSSLNPVIYCWKMRHIRRAIMNTLRRIFTPDISVITEIASREREM